MIRPSKLCLLSLVCLLCVSCSSDLSGANGGQGAGVENLKAVGDCDGITISWDRLEGIDSYSVRRSKQPNDADPPEVHNVPTLPCRDIPPERGTTYYYWVTATGDTTGPVSAAQKPLPPRPSGIWADGNGTIVEVTWRGATQDYDFQESYLPAGSTDWADQPVVKLRPATRKPNSNLFFKQANELPQGMRFRVRAVNVCGHGSWTAWVEK